MKLLPGGDQHVRHFTFGGDFTITANNAPQLVLPENTSRSFLMLQNNSSAAFFYGFGAGRATCTISGGQVATVTVTNAGFGFSRAPRVHFLGGGILPQQGVYPANTAYIGSGNYGFPSPSHRALATAVMTGSAPNMSISSISIEDPGAGYVIAPYVQIVNDVFDPNGAYDPSAGGGTGFVLPAFGQLYLAHSAVTTDALAVFCKTATSPFSVMWMP